MPSPRTRSGTPKPSERRVVLIFGPPGSGKSTLAKSLGLEVFDRDDPKWLDDEGQFRAALRRIGSDPAAQAAVIRSGATQRARDLAVEACRPTEVRMLNLPADECIRRVRARRRGDVKAQIVAVESWWRKHREDGGTPRRRVL